MSSKIQRHYAFGQGADRLIQVILRADGGVAVLQRTFANGQWSDPGALQYGAASDPAKPVKLTAIISGNSWGTLALLPGGWQDIYEDIDVHLLGVVDPFATDLRYENPTKANTSTCRKMTFLFENHGDKNTPDYWLTHTSEPLGCKKLEVQLNKVFDKKNSLGKSTTFSMVIRLTDGPETGKSNAAKLKTKNLKAPKGTDLTYSSP